jgi:hypothetical protein
MLKKMEIKAMMKNVKKETVLSNFVKILEEIVQKETQLKERPLFYQRIWLLSSKLS